MNTGKLKKNFLKVLSISLLSGCSTLKVEDVKVCSVSGIIDAGAHCVTSLSGRISRMTIDQYIEFLEPSEKENRGGALCMSSKDWASIKTSLEQACKLLEGRCTKEIQQSIDTVVNFYEGSIDAWNFDRAKNSEGN